MLIEKFMAGPFTSDFPFFLAVFLGRFSRQFAYFEPFAASPDVRSDSALSFFAGSHAAPRNGKQMALVRAPFASRLFARRTRRTFSPSLAFFIAFERTSSSSRTRGRVIGAVVLIKRRIFHFSRR